MRKGALGVVLGAGVALSGCASGWHAKSGDTYGKPERPPAVDPQWVVESACADWRWIGVKKSPAAACPAPPRGWSARPLFDPAKRKLVCADSQRPDPQPAGISSAAVGEQLDRFCVYETPRLRWWSRRRPFASARAAGLAKLDRDCATIAPASDGDPTVWKPLADNFLAQAGQAPGLTIKNHGGVRLVFLDTEPTGEVVPLLAGPALHGYTLANIARHLVCSPENGPCAAKITTRLALSLVTFDSDHPLKTVVDTKKGGFIGTQQELADAIYAEVNAWQTAPSQKHLVLNLSLGWDPTILGDLDAKGLEQLHAGSEAVYRALQFAQSSGALVMAAAGNRRECDPDTAGPVLPGGWEEEPPLDDPHRAAPTVPLIYAVGAVGFENKPLPNARGMGMPKRVAYGEYAVVPAGRPVPLHSTWLYSGSSVATAVVSSAAALVWDSFPDLTREQVMDILYRSGSSTDLPATFWFRGGAEAPPMHRISVCGALAIACAENTDTDMSCPLITPCRRPPSEEPTVPDEVKNALSASCHPWVVPQPEDPPCPPCGPDDPGP